MLEAEHNLRKSFSETVAILILHDSPSAAAAIIEILREAGFTINWQLATTAQEYRDRLSPEFDLILYHGGVARPKFTEVLDLLSEYKLNLPAIVINGEASIRTAVSAMKAGATDYIPSTNLSKLPTAVFEALGKRNICSQLAKCTAETEQQLQQLIDDNSRDLLIFILENEGVKTKGAASATEALEVIEQFQPDILVSDIGMPGMDGYELIQKIKQLPTIHKENFTAIAFSAYASDSEQQKSLAAGFDRHLNKPLDVNKFLQVITQLADINF